MLAIGKDLRLQWEKRPSRVDEVETRQVVLQGDLLRAHVLLDGERIIGAALDGGVVGHDHALDAADAADPRDDAGGRRFAVVHLIGGQRGDFEERRLGVEEQVDPLAGGLLPLLSVPPLGARPSALARLRQPFREDLCEPLVILPVRRELGRAGIDLGVEDRHGVLFPPRMTRPFLALGRGERVSTPPSEEV